MALRVWAALILLFLFIPILVILVYAFNSSNIETWPLPGLSTKWLASTWEDPEIQSALVLSLQAGPAGPPPAHPPGPPSGLACGVCDSPDKLLRARRDQPAVHPSACPARDRDGNGAELV